MNDLEVEQLQEAGSDIAWLTSQGYSPTEAIAKVASAAKFPVPKTRLLTYAYANGVSAEKRASTGGPFERLAEFPLPDPNEIHRLVYGEPDKLEVDPDSEVAKTASSHENFLPWGMATFEKDISGMSRSEKRELFGLPVKTAGDDGETDEEGHPVGCGVSISRTTIRIGLGSPCTEESDEPVTEIPDSFQEKLSSLIKRMSPETAEELETTLLRLLGTKKNAMLTANAEADEAWQQAVHSLDRLGKRLRHRHLSPSEKRAGLFSVNSYYPEIAALLGSYLDEVNGRLIKAASCDLLQTKESHPWVAEAKIVWQNLEHVVDRTVDARRKYAEYQAVKRLYDHRDKIRKSADWSSFLAGSLMPGIGTGAKELLMGSEQSKQKSAIRDEVLNNLVDELHDHTLRDIETQSMINDFTGNDEILSAYEPEKLIRGYNDLVRTAPSTMRNRAQARALLQQYMTQGRMAPSELMPALQMNKLDPRKGSLTGEEKKKHDE